MHCSKENQTTIWACIDCFARQRPKLGIAKDKQMEASQITQQTHLHTHRERKRDRERRRQHMLLFMRSRANNPLLFCYHSRAPSPNALNHPSVPATPCSLSSSSCFAASIPTQAAKRLCLCLCLRLSPLNFYLICRLRKLIVCLLLSVKTIENILATVTLAKSVLETCSKALWRGEGVQGSAWQMCRRRYSAAKSKSG